MQVHDRKFAPHPWLASKDRVAPDCQWSHRGLVVAWPGWKMAGRLYGGSFADANVQAKGAPFHPGHQICFANSNAGGLRGSTLSAQAGDHYNGGPMVAVLESSVVGFPTGPMTVILHYRKLDTTNRTSCVLSHSTNTPAGYFFLDCPNAAGTVRFFYGGGTEPANGLTVGGLSFGDNVWAVTVGARGIEIWQDGIKRASNGSNPTRTAQATYWGLFGGLGSVFGADFAESGACLVYNRQLDVEEILRLTIDPWTPFRPAHRIRTRASVSAAIARRRMAGIVGG